jgi:hypothetical protein
VNPTASPTSPYVLAMSWKRYHSASRARLTRCLLLALCCGLLGLADEATAQQKTILYVYNPDQNTGADGLDEDSMYLTILEDRLGYEVVLIGMNQVSTADTAGVDAIYISESVGSGAVVNNLINPATGGSRFGNFGVPIITPEVFVWDDMRWIRTGEGFGIDQAWGFAESEKINILGTSHPILGGLRPGPVDVYLDPPISTQQNDASNLVGYGVPQPTADIAAAVPGVARFNGQSLTPFNEARMSLFTYEVGDTLVSDTVTVVANARRVALFAHSRGGENLNEVGQQLFANAIAWAVGDESQIQHIEADRPRILYVLNPDQNTGQDGLDEDALYLSILTDTLGYEPILVGMNQVSTADTADVDLIYISESVGSGAIVNNFINPLTGGQRFGNVGIPIVTPEVFVWDDMQWIRTGEGFGIDQAWGFAESDSVISTGIGHPILNGLPAGAFDIFDAPPTSTQQNDASNLIGYGVPKPSADIVLEVNPQARFNGAPLVDFPETRASLFTYEFGDTLIAADSLTLVTRARRVGLFAHSRGGENLNAAGRQLFMNAILWAAGREAESNLIPAGPVATDEEPELPTSFAIESIYPNPFNPTATALLSVKETGPYELRIFDVLGRLVQRRLIQVQVPGQVQVGLELQQQASGMYLVQVVQRQTGRIATAKAILVK